MVSRAGPSGKARYPGGEDFFFYHPLEACSWALAQT
jgi:hypothetical protein